MKRLRASSALQESALTLSGSPGRLRSRRRAQRCLSTSPLRSLPPAFPHTITPAAVRCPPHQPPCAPQLALSARNLCPLRTSTRFFPATERVVDAVLAAPPPPSARRGAAADKALLSQSADKARIDGVPPGGAFAHAGSGAAGVPGAGRRVRSKFSSARAGMRVKTAVEVAPLILAPTVWMSAPPRHAHAVLSRTAREARHACC